ncbi:hypothetical protein F5Y03DRAFT_405890 [Xylaria venustula]|nr:hypothetical protein F5Y03DRAFT_405890 [Xylaria venustula]
MAHSIQSQRGDTGYHEHFLAKKGKKIEVFQKIKEIDTGIKMDKFKTIGTISAKNSDQILKPSKSVLYSQGTSETHQEDLCWKSIEDVRMQGILLASWYVVELVRTQFNFVNKKEEDLITQIKRLKNVALFNKRTAFITIDSQPCRTCLQFLHRLSEYTEILFQIKDSRGVGPVQVRVGGGRREDVISETFMDSDDESVTLDNEPSAEVVKPSEAIENAEVNNDHPATPVTPKSKSTLRRPATSWQHTPWTPENPEQLLSLYKRKTPVYEWPSYNRDIHNTQLNPDADKTVNTIAEAGDLDEWVDVGDDILMYCTSPKPTGSEGSPIKSEKHQSPDLRTQDGAKLSQIYSDSNNFAESAYQAVQESTEDTDFEIVTAEETYGAHRRMGRFPIPRPRSIRNHKPYKQRWAQLYKYRHHDLDDSNESVLKNRYSILRPPTGR